METKKCVGQARLDTAFWKGDPWYLLVGDTNAPIQLGSQGRCRKEAPSRRPLPSFPGLEFRPISAGTSWSISFWDHHCVVTESTESYGLVRGTATRPGTLHWRSPTLALQSQRLGSQCWKSKRCETRCKRAGNRWNDMEMMCSTWCPIERASPTSFSNPVMVLRT